MEEVRLTTNEAIMYAMIPVGIGFALGLIPLVVGIVKGKVRIGIIGLIVTTIGGALLGVILSIPSMALFTWLIMRDQIKPEPATPSTDNEQNIDNRES